jgi:hypothetical protein
LLASICSSSVYIRKKNQEKKIFKQCRIDDKYFFFGVGGGVFIFMIVFILSTGVILIDDPLGALCSKAPSYTQ